MEIISKSYLSTLGITRAKEELYLITTEKNGPNDKHRCVASRFISEIYK